MRAHLHHDQSGLMSRAEIGKTLFVMGLTDRPLTAQEVMRIETTALRKLKVAIRKRKFAGLW